jgi:hypothetical protein
VGLIALLAAGCAQEVTLDVRLGRSPVVTDAEAQTPVPAGVTVNNPILLEKVGLVLGQVRLESAPSVDDQASLARQTFAEGPLPVLLEGDALRPGTLTRIVQAAHVATGGYVELDAALETLTLQGRYDGAPFTFTSALAKTLRARNTFLMGTNRNALILSFDAATWFQGDAAVLDPRDPGNRARIEANVVQSFTAYEDDDLNGVPDPG